MAASKPRWLNDDEERAWRGYHRMRRLLDLQIARDLQACGLSEPDYDVLSTLSEQEGGRWRARELGNWLAWSTSRLTHHVNRMEARGLVAKEPSPDDGRAMVITLTEQGWQVIRAAAPDHVESVRRHFIDLLTPAELSTLERIAGRVIEHLGE